MEVVVINIRLPRILLAYLVGCCLSSAGAAYQSVFQNPMAAPDILGTSSGAAFGAALAILLGLPTRLITLLAFVSSIVTVLVVYLVGQRAPGKRVVNLILAGIMVSSLFSAGTSFIKLVADPSNQLPAITYWLMGSLSGARLQDVSFVLLPMALGLVPLLLLRWRMNILTLGDEEARTMGVHPGRLRLIVVLCSTLVTATTGDAYRKLGELLNMADEAAALADYCDSVFARTNEIAGSVEKARLLCCLGDRGINVIAQGSYHAEIIDLLSDNLAVVDSPSSKGSGNEVDMEQILAWNPDVILFAPGSIYATVGEDPTWQSVNAIRDGRYYEVPFGPYNWMGFPPSVQRYLGMMWMAELLYPETAGYDLYTEVANYFRLFYHCDITEDQYHAFVAESIDRRG